MREETKHLLRKFTRIFSSTLKAPATAPIRVWKPLLSQQHATMKRNLNKIQFTTLNTIAIFWRRNNFSFFFVCLVFYDTGIQVGFLNALNALWHSCMKREASCTDRTWFAVLCGLLFWENQLEPRIQSHRHVSWNPFLNLLPNLQSYFLKFPGHHFRSALLKQKTLFVNWGLSLLIVTELWSVELEPSATLASHAANFNKKISNSFGFKYHNLNSSTLWTCLSLKLKFVKP